MRSASARVCFHAQIVEPFLEGLEMRVAIPVVVVTNGIEIPEAAIDRQITAPIVLVTFEGDVLTWLDHADDIRPAAEQWFEARVFEGGRIDRVFRQHRHEADDQRKFPIVGAR